MASPPSPLPASGRDLLVSETFVSVQGEGISAGLPAAFLRLGNCNLACRFCDTAYTWDGSRYDLERELRRREVGEVAAWIVGSAPGRLIVTGGEPLLQQKQLVRLLAEVDRAWRGAKRLVVEVETNGTVLPRVPLLERVDQWNVSPKLKNSGETEARRLRESVLHAFSNMGSAHFKFVVRHPSDAEEVDNLVEIFGLRWERVSLMPEALDKEELRMRGPLVSQWALARKAHYSSRLHLELFDGRRGS